MSATRAYTRCRYGQMHYWDATPAEATAPTLVLLHQNPSASMEYAGLIEEMARDRRVVAFDTPGYGMSDAPPGPPTMAEYAASFVDAIAALDLAENAPLDVFGFHTGALLAAELGLALPNEVGRLVLSGIPMRDPADRAARYRDALATPQPTEDGAGILARSAALYRYVVTDRTAGVPLARAVELFAEKNRTLDHGAWAYHGVWSYDYARLPLIVQPTLVLQPHDALLDASRAASALIPGARFVDLPGLDRDIFEIAIPQIAQALRDFLIPVSETEQ
ncbi:alpha/beta fold hydrolase [Sphingomonas faeni]|uniref:alpha/beta fold hydrolase n=1 Tax=Sphingomonas faeni TaxID=185950 RepID=UPI0020C7FBBD|nr:alpha/beta hydrolase [Sphingomonas faeni]